MSEIHVSNIRTVGKDIRDMFELVNGDGKNFLANFKNNYESIKGHWRGSDAKTNLDDLALVYEETGKLVNNLLNYISAGNEEIRGLQNDNNANGGEYIQVADIIEPVAVDLTLSAAESTVESWVDAGILTDASNFASTPQEFNRFISGLNQRYEVLMKNWLSSVNHDMFVNTFNKFQNDVGNYINAIEKVAKNLDTVAENKRKYL